MLSKWSILDLAISISRSSGSSREVRGAKGGWLEVITSPFEVFRQGSFLDLEPGRRNRDPL
jgi:hypothetical protein